jgi:Domain of unknown function (DUF4159)
VSIPHPRSFRLALVLVIAAATVALFTEVIWRRSVPNRLPEVHVKPTSTTPPDTLRGSEPEPVSERAHALQIVRLIHSGDWDIAPQTIPNLMTALREPPFRSNVMLTQKDLFARDSSLVYHPFTYITGSGPLSLPSEDLAALRRHLAQGGGMVLADAACGSRAFDAAFRRFVADLLPNHKLEPIPRDDELYAEKVGFELSQCHYTKAAGGIKDYPTLEGVKIDGHWAVIYSKYGIGCVLDREHDGGCRGYIREDAAKIWWRLIGLSPSLSESL